MSRHIRKNSKPDIYASPLLTTTSSRRSEELEAFLPNHVHTPDTTPNIASGSEWSNRRQQRLKSRRHLMCALGLGMMVVILGFAGLDQNGNLDGVDSWQNVKGSVVKWGEGYGLGLGSEGQAEKLGEEEGEKAFVDSTSTTTPSQVSPEINILSDAMVEMSSSLHFVPTPTFASEETAPSPMYTIINDQGNGDEDPSYTSPPASESDSGSDDQGSGDADEPSSTSGPTSEFNDDDDAVASEDDSTGPTEEPTPVPMTGPIFIDPSPRPYPISPEVTDEKYLSFLPHSGYHNQRISVQNALRLAVHLNRTLLLPPAWLGRPTGWAANGRLQRSWDSMVSFKVLDESQRGIECKDYEYKEANDELGEGERKKEYCEDADHTSLTSWNWITDFTEIEKNQKVVDRWDMRRSWFFKPREEGGLGLKGEKDIHTIKDTKRYSYQIRDSRNDKFDIGKYEYPLFLDDLKAIDQPLLEFGSLFGSGRLRIVDKENRKKARWVGGGLIFGNEYLEQMSQEIVTKMGGMQNYLGLHLRVGDGFFYRKAAENMLGSFRLICTEVFGLDRPTIDKLVQESKDIQAEKKKKQASTGHRMIKKRYQPSSHGVRSSYFFKREPWEDEDSVDEQDGQMEIVEEEAAAAAEAGEVEEAAVATFGKRAIDLRPINDPSELGIDPAMTCRLPLRTDIPILNQPIYVATDSKSPLTDPNLAIIFNIFPCTFILEDFAAAEGTPVNSAPVVRLREMERMRNSLDGVKLIRFMRPFLEAQGVAKARAMVGTYGSSFSAYAKGLLHNAYLRTATLAAGTA